MYQKMIAESDFIMIDNARPFERAGGEVIQRTLTAFFRKYPDKYDGYRLKSIWY